MSTSQYATEAAFLADLYTGKSTRHGLLFSPPAPERPVRGGCYTLDNASEDDWFDWGLRWYEERRRWHEKLHDDVIPFFPMETHTGVFAAAFGAEIHTFDGQETSPCALPFIHDPKEADRLPEASLSHPVLERIFRQAERAVRVLGPDVPIGVPDIQSPFDIAALIWDKSDLFVAMIEEPESVLGLVGKCGRLLHDFLTAYHQIVPNLNPAHCPYCWAPREMGLWLSEDEAGAISTPMFADFCMPSLMALSRDYGGINLHCCADADHQYPELLKLPDFRVFNRHFTRDPEITVEAFKGRTTLISGWCDDAFVERMLKMARPETRYLFCLYPGNLEAAQQRQEFWQEKMRI